MSTRFSAPVLAKKPSMQGCHEARALQPAWRVVVCVALLAAGLLATPFAASAGEEEWAELYPAADRVVLDLQAIGDVTVTTHDHDTILVQRIAGKSVVGPEVDISMEGDELHISTEPCPEFFNRVVNDCSVSFTLAVPPSTDITGSLAHGEISLVGLGEGATLRTGSGDISVSEVDGELELDTGHGAVDVAGAGGPVTVTSGHGDLSFAEIAGDLNATTGHGQIEVDGADGPLTVETGSGDVIVNGSGGETVSISSGHGAVELRTTTAPMEAEIRTGQGDVLVLLPPGSPPYAVSLAGDDEPNLTIATDPDARHTLSVSTGHGTISVGYGGE